MGMAARLVMRPCGRRRLRAGLVGLAMLRQHVRRLPVPCSSCKANCGTSCTRRSCRSFPCLAAAALALSTTVRPQHSPFCRRQPLAGGTRVRAATLCAARARAYGHAWGMHSHRLSKQAPCAGSWRGLDVAIKTVVFQSGPDSDQIVHVASEAAIASNLLHANIVATFAHDICMLAAPSMNNELSVFKFYLIQVRPFMIHVGYDAVLVGMRNVSSSTVELA
jgi:hypothetical protein